MDEFDKKITNAQQSYEPKPNFVEATMEQLPEKVPKKRWNIKIWAPALAGTVAVVAIVFIVWPRPITNDSTSTNHVATPATTTPPTTNDPSLQGDLDDVQSSMDQTSSDQSSADSAVNDNGQQITVPTE